jgi:hypothetical protein
MKPKPADNIDTDLEIDDEAKRVGKGKGKGKGKSALVTYATSVPTHPGVVLPILSNSGSSGESPRPRRRTDGARVRKREATRVGDLVESSLANDASPPSKSEQSSRLTSCENDLDSEDDDVSWDLSFPSFLSTISISEIYNVWLVCPSPPSPSNQNRNWDYSQHYVQRFYHVWHITELLRILVTSGK